jgi:hypothetical protein
VKSNFHTTVKLRPALFLMLTVNIFCSFGCQDVALVSARKEAALGQYNAAHRDYETAVLHRDKLSPKERREALDGVCLTEYLVGGPTYPLEQQYVDCAKASAEPDSKSREITAQIADAMRAKARLKVEKALKRHNLSEAILNAQDYSQKPGASRVAVAQWSEQIWQLIASRDNARAVALQKSLGPAIAALRQRNPQVHGLNRQAFEQWVRAELTVNGQMLFSGLSVKGPTLHLSVPQSLMPTLALNLDRLSRANDAFAAWCGCDARTDVALADTQLPAYLLRLDPDTAHSQILMFTPG